jgi:A/G-specific adenine glycosylase
MPASLPAALVADSDIALFQAVLLRWFAAFGRVFPWRRPGLNEYELIIAEALLQRTRADIVAKHYEAFLQAYPDWQALASVDPALLEAHIRPLGMAAQRGPKLLALAKEMVRRGGILPRDRQELATIPFFGHYLLYAAELLIFHQPAPLLDVNMARLLERYFGLQRRPDLRRDPPLQKLAARVANHPESKHLNWAILDFATLVCKSQRPLCPGCPLNRDCQYFELELATLI